VTTPLPRDQFAVTKDHVYLNHAAVGVLPQSSLEALSAALRAQAQGGVLGTYRNEARMDEFRAAIGRFIGASGDEIAVVANTSAGANAIALGIDWQAGDEVLLCDNEFPANAIPWLALQSRGVVARVLPAQQQRLTPDVLRRTITARTRVVAVSWVSYADGYRHDLGALSEVARTAGAWLCVDPIQGLGAFPLDVRQLGIDALYCGAQKWMLGLQGVGFLYVRGELLERIAPAMPGWRSMCDIWDFGNFGQPFAPDASRYEGGTPNFLGALSLGEAIDLFERCGGPAAIGPHVLALTDRLYEGLRRAGAQLATLRGEGISSGIVTFAMPGCDSIELGKALQQSGIVTTYRSNGIRVAPHGYNDSEEIDRLLEAVTQYAPALAAKL